MIITIKCIQQESNVTKDMRFNRIMTAVICKCENCNRTKKQYRRKKNSRKRREEI